MVDTKQIKDKFNNWADRLIGEYKSFQAIRLRMEYQQARIDILVAAKAALERIIKEVESESH